MSILIEFSISKMWNVVILLLNIYIVTKKKVWKETWAEQFKQNENKLATNVVFNQIKLN